MTGAALAGRGVNRCTLTVAKAGEVCVTGRKYVDSTIVLRRAAANCRPTPGQRTDRDGCNAGQPRPGHRGGKPCWTTTHSGDRPSA
ncbi:MAG: hypothetical protein ACLUFT_11020 [Gemmiger formicilis]|uniref:hypothetical protein n=1 Tax=Gemmiger formicilis TaxID=745368 RepID=UPI003993784F